jgi:hypothetical protein
MAILATILPELWRENNEEGRTGEVTGFILDDLADLRFQDIELMLVVLLLCMFSNTHLDSAFRGEH